MLSTQVNGRNRAVHMLLSGMRYSMQSCFFFQIRSQDIRSWSMVLRVLSLLLLENDCDVALQTDRLVNCRCAALTLSAATCLVRTSTINLIILYYNKIEMQFVSFQSEVSFIQMDLFYTVCMNRIYAAWQTGHNLTSAML